MKNNILYVFGGEKAQGAEIVIERLMYDNMQNINAHLFVAPGNFASKLLQDEKPYKISVIEELKKLNRSSSGALKFYAKAIKNYFSISHKVYRYIKSNKINVVHANTIVPSTYLIPLILFSKIAARKIKFIWSDHDLTYHSRLDYWFSKICVFLYDVTIVVSKAVKGKYKQNSKIIVLYNGLNTNHFKNDSIAGYVFRQDHEIEKDALVIGMAAVIVPRKGQLELIKSFESLPFKNKNLKLLLAGRYGDDNPDYNQKVKSAVESNGKILHVGYVDDMANFYSACDVVVSNTDTAGSEPLGTSIYEAMAFEKIVLASNTGGTPEIITDQVDGFLFTAGKPFELLAKLEEVISNYPMYGNIRKAARKKVELKFNIRTMTSNYNRILNNLYISNYDKADR